MGLEIKVTRRHIGYDRKTGFDEVRAIAGYVNPYLEELVATYSLGDHQKSLRVVWDNVENELYLAELSDSNPTSDYSLAALGQYVGNLIDFFRTGIRTQKPADEIGEVLSALSGHGISPLLIPQIQSSIQMGNSIPSKVQRRLKS